MEVKVSELQRAYPIEQDLPLQPGSGVKEGGKSFQDILAQRLERESGVKFSHHAVERLSERNISLTDHDLTRLNRAVQTMESKGSRDSLLVMGDLALVVSIKNRMVVTALDSHPNAQRVFTNIDSAMIV
jgi:flagellar operon protein